MTAFAALVALVIRREPFGGPVWLEIGSRRQVGVWFAVPLVEPFHHDGRGRHVDAQGQRFGGGRGALGTQLTCLVRGVVLT